MKEKLHRRVVDGWPEYIVRGFLCFSIGTEHRSCFGLKNEF